jgi:hypothetical protein
LIASMRMRSARAQPWMSPIAITRWGMAAQ